MNDNPEPKDPAAYNKRTDEELWQLALDAAQGRVFGSWNIRFDDNYAANVRMVFLPFALMSRESAALFHEQRISAFYEYVREAGPRSCNGLPVFFSMRLLNEDDYNRFAAFYNEALSRVQQLASSPPPEVSNGQSS